MADLKTDVATYRRLTRHRPLLNVATLLGVVALLVLAVVNYRQAQIARDKGERADAQRVTWVAQARDLGEQIAKSNVCTSTDQADVDQFGYLCEQARKVKDQAEPKPVDTQALASAVSALVVATLPERVDAAVRRYLAEHPLASKDEVREWVKAEVALIPPAQDGTPGQDGSTGPGPTEEQLDAAVARYLAEHPPASGPPGPPGDGVPGGCEWQRYLYPDGVPGMRCVVSN